MIAELGSPHPGLEGCMELKTNKVIENEKQEMIFHKFVADALNRDFADTLYRKLLKHWVQSWLLGIPVSRAV
jgi:RAT1-interacting protein